MLLDHSPGQAANSRSLTWSTERETNVPRQPGPHAEHRARTAGTRTPERLPPFPQPVRPSRSTIPFVQLELRNWSSAKLQDALVSCSAGSWSSLEQRSLTDSEVRSRPDVISCAN